MASYDAIVLGAGGVGSAAMYQFARRGARVLGVDTYRPPHTRGSTHGHTRVIRQAYFEHADYVPLLRESYREWFDLERVVGRKLFHQIGLVEIGPADGTVVPGVLRAAALHDLNVLPLSSAEIAGRWPGLQAGEGMSGVFEPAAGYLLVEDCVQAHLDAAEAAGAELAIDTAEPVANGEFWQADKDCITIQLRNRGVVKASRLIIAAGPWASGLLSGLGVPLTVLRKSLFWFKSPSHDYDVDTGMPVFLFELSHGVFYGFPQIASRGVKVAEHSGGRLTDPNAVDQTLDADEQSRVEKFLSSHLPGVSHEVIEHATCLYTMSPDEHFIVDQHPAEQRVSFVAGLSGHGFKFTPLLGRILADIALDGGTTLPTEFLSVNRFQGG